MKCSDGRGPTDEEMLDMGRMFRAKDPNATRESLLMLLGSVLCERCLKAAVDAAFGAEPVGAPMSDEAMRIRRQSLD